MNRFLDKTNAPMMRFFDVLYKLIILNLLFILHTIMGLVLFGIFPSFITLFSLIKRQFFDQEEGMKYTTEFYKTWKKHLIKGNQIFIFIVLIVGITILDLVYLYQNYLVIDELSFIGVFLSLGGLLLSYIVFSLVSFIPLVIVFFERFSFKETIKFSFFMTLTSPLLSFANIVLYGLSYLLFSVLISAAPFIGASVPVYLIVILYIKRFRKIFLVDSKDGYTYLNFKFNANSQKNIDCLNSILPDERSYINVDHYLKVLDDATIEFQNSLVVMDHKGEVVGLLLVKRDGENGVIELIVTKKGFQQQGIGLHMIQLLETSNQYQKIICTTNKVDYHQSLQYTPILKHLLKKLGYLQIEDNQFYKVLTEVTK